jgi:hypothetical protein
VRPTRRPPPSLWHLREGMPCVRAGLPGSAQRGSSRGTCAAGAPVNNRWTAPCERARVGDARARVSGRETRAVALDTHVRSAVIRSRRFHGSTARSATAIEAAGPSWILARMNRQPSELHGRTGT